jgi:type II secretory pathway pseudopilin PulG
MRTALRAARDVARRSEGFTVVEVVVAVLLLSVGILATVSVLDGSRNLTAVAQKENTAAQVGQQEMERLLGLGYAKIGLTSTPIRSSDPANPNFYVTTGGLFQWDRTTATRTESFCGPANCPGGLVGPPEDWSAGTLKGQIHRYVTWSDDLCANCPTTTDYKRVTVVLTMAGPNAPKRPIVVSTIVADPNAGPGAS